MNHLSPNAQRITNYDGIVLPPNIKRETEKPKPTLRIRAGAYLRLSRDDGKYKLVSASIETQRDIITTFAASQGFEIYDFYTDDGYTGTNFDRPDWKRMIADVDSGKVNMIICKDLSRVGRDAVGFGIFHNEYCIEKGLRLISVSDGIDTSVDGYDQIIDILNMYNAWYPKDISKKTRFAKAARAANGWFIGSNPPFGYIKSPDNYHVLTPSVDAPLVLEVFERFVHGDTLRQISDDFNARGVITPSQRIMADNPNRSSRAVSPVWTSTTMTQILNNMVYIGHMVQGKRRKLSYKSKKVSVVPANEHIVVLNTHEPIVQIDLWNAVQQNRKGRSTPRKTERTPGLNLFAGFVKCADCGNVLAATKKSTKSESYDLLRCARYNNGGKNACSGHTIRYEALYAIVLENIQHYTTLAFEDEQLLTSRLYQAMLLEEEADVKARAKDLLSLKLKHDMVRQKIERLYDEKFGKGMDEDIFNSMRAQYVQERIKLEAELSVLENEVARTHYAEKSISCWMDAIKQALNIDSLNREVISALIDRIVVYEREKVDNQVRQRVDIFYKFVGNLSGECVQKGKPETLPLVANI